MPSVERIISSSGWVCEGDWKRWDVDIQCDFCSWFLLF